MLVIKKVPYAEVASLRIDYLRSLPQFQEFYLELLVQEARCYLLKIKDVLLGYAIATREHALIEFYLRDEYASQTKTCLREFVEKQCITSILCKSFDTPLLDFSHYYAFFHETTGYLFRDIVDAPTFPLGDLTPSVATESDLTFLLQQKDGLYDTPEELEYFVKRRSIVLFQRQGELMGCGLLTQIHEMWNYCDIGMWTKPEYRKQGIATCIISYLKETCLQNARIPIAGCHAQNDASKRILEKNGLVSRHTLIEFTVN